MSAPTMTVDEARSLLAQLAAGQFDQYITDHARLRLRRDAEGVIAAAEHAAATAPPIAEAVLIAVDRKGIRSVTVRCPYCKGRNGKARVHIHGWPRSSDDREFLRRPHCLDGVRRREYRIVVPAELAEAGR